VLKSALLAAVQIYRRR